MLMGLALDVFAVAYCATLAWIAVQLSPARRRQARMTHSRLRRLQELRSRSLASDTQDAA
jgi:hypothetical protein